MNPEVIEALKAAKQPAAVQGRMRLVSKLRNCADTMGFVNPTDLRQTANELDTLGALVIDLELPPEPLSTDDPAQLRNREAAALEKVMQLALQLAATKYKDDTNPHTSDEADMYEDYLRDRVIEYANAIKDRRAHGA